MWVTLHENVNCFRFDSFNQLGDQSMCWEFCSRNSLRVAIKKLITVGSVRIALEHLKLFLACRLPQAQLNCGALSSTLVF